MAADEIGYDMIEQILIRSDVKDLMRCRGICKSWYSLISTPYFSDCYLKQAYKNDPQLNKKITGIGRDTGYLIENELFVIGSANGLVCVSPEGFELLVVNPCTRQAMKILEPPPQPLPESDQRWDLVWGFGYDSSNDDYKIVVGLVVNVGLLIRSRTRFYVYSLKTCVWKFIEEYDYAAASLNTVAGILYDGALHWDMRNSQNEEVAIFSFNLSREEFTKTQMPDRHSVYQDSTYSNTLGLMEGSLCLYVGSWTSTEIWVLKSDNDNSGKLCYWELLPENYVMSYDAVYLMDDDDDDDDDDAIDDSPRVVLCNTCIYIAAPTYVRSLVSPYVNKDSSSKSVAVSVEEKAGRMTIKKINALIS